MTTVSQRLDQDTSATTATMTKSEQAQKANDGAKSKSNGKNHSSKSTMCQLNALLKNKRAKQNKHKIKASFKDSKGNDIKEMIYTLRDGDPPELLFELEKQLLKLSDRYDLFERGRWKDLCKIGGRALEKFKKLIQKVNLKYLRKEAIKDQRDATEFRELRFEGHDHMSVLFNEEADKFLDREMARQVIPKNLKTAASLKEADANNQTNSRNGNSGQNDQNTSNGSNDLERRDAARRRKHDGAHHWKDCPDNWWNQASNNSRGQTKSRSPSSAQANSSQKSQGEVKSTESQGSTNGLPMVCIESDCKADNKSCCSSHMSCGELMKIVAKADNWNLHPITIITLLNNRQKRVACKTLLDQCCTDKGLIFLDMTEMLSLPMVPSNPKVFAMANGTFSSTEAPKLEGAMLPCLSTNRTFTIELMVIPKECCVVMNYGVIIGQESMRLLDLDTSICDAISWGDCEVRMVPHDHWMKERILQQKLCLLKQPHTTNNNKSTKIPDKVFTAKALVAVKYTKVNLDDIAKGCDALNAEQEVKLLAILRKHEALFQGKHGD
ncbi:hypothetical protein HJC23_001827 [Cyclotella cryptica]|uniref:Uncharacterized protein n=1 Tax=Cyclotella cryptica TaxID=29204 RepID=A0ABD3PH22_9STRA